MDPYIPDRIQRRRTKGWRMPPRTLNCTRGSKYGNPYRVGDRVPAEQTPPWVSIETDGLSAPLNAEDAVYCYKIALIEGKLPYSIEEARRELRGYAHLACWCADGAPCHAYFLTLVAGACDWCKPHYMANTFVIDFSDADTGRLISRQVICDMCWKLWVRKVNAHGSGLGEVRRVA